MSSVRETERPSHAWTRSTPGGVSEADRLLLVVVTVAGVVALAAIVTGRLSTAVVGRGWPRYRMADAPGIIGRIVAKPGDPGRAWDAVNTGGAPPGPIAWWVVF